MKKTRKQDARTAGREVVTDHPRIESLKSRDWGAGQKPTRAPRASRVAICLNLVLNLRIDTSTERRAKGESTARQIVKKGSSVHLPTRISERTGSQRPAARALPRTVPLPWGPPRAFPQPLGSRSRTLGRGPARVDPVLLASRCRGSSALFPFAGSSALFPFAGRVTPPALRNRHWGGHHVPTHLPSDRPLVP